MGIWFRGVLALLLVVVGLATGAWAIGEGTAPSHDPDWRPLRLVMIGPPGAGKGTQARLLGQAYGIPVIATGHLLRTAAAAGKKPEGVDLKAVMDRGELVPDTVVVALLRERLKKPDAARGWIIHGFPRTLVQALALDAMLAEERQVADLVVSLTAPDAVVLERLSDRLTCRTCGTTYNQQTRPPQAPGVCDEDGGELVMRHDDQGATAKRRLADYHAISDPVVAYFASRNGFHKVDGTKTVNEVQRTLAGLVGKNR